MAGVGIPKSAILFVIAWLVLAGGCAKFPRTDVTPIKAKNTSELRGYLLTHKPDLDQFRLRGPFAVAEQRNVEIRLSTGEIVTTDLFLSAHNEKAPLVIILHGHESSKDEHSFQAMHLASWGIHCLTLQLPNHGPWIDNGKTLARIVSHINHRPQIFDNRFDVNRIILVGHSYGGFAVAIALAEGAPAAGGILLDPAVGANGLPAYLRKINTPLMIIGADKNVSEAHNRDDFYRYVRSGVAEVSIKDASHEDAQYPADSARATEELQITFVSALTAAAISLSAHGNFDYAWTSFGIAIEKGILFNAIRK